MQTKLGAVLGALLALVVVSCSPKAADTEKRAEASAALTTGVKELTTAILAESPELATSLGLTEAEAGGRFANRLSDLSPEGLARQKALVEQYAQRFAGVPVAVLGAQDAVSHDVISASLRHAAAGAQFGYGNFGFGGAPTPYVVSQLTGAYQYIPDFLDSQHAIRTTQDAEDYLARLEAFAGQLDQETARVAADAAKGVIPPKFILERTLIQLRAIAGKPAPTTTLVTSLTRRAAQIEGVSPVQVADLSRRAIALVRDKVQPALQRQIAAITALVPQSSEQASVARLPNGEAYYRAALAAWTTSEKTPDEIHQMGLDLIASLTAEMDALLKAQGMSEGAVGTRIQALSATSAQLYPNTDAGKTQLLADLNAQVTAMNARLPEMFGTVPAAPLQVRRVPPEIEAGAPGGYYQSPALDGSRPGMYYINLRNTREWPRFTLPTLTYHEGTPGHHLQGAIAQSANCTPQKTTDCLPLIRSAVLWFSGYGEGWALYAEQLADEMGFYRNDPWGRLGYLQSMTFRAARLVVDTGLHAKNWSKEQAIDYMVSVTGDQRSGIETEVERYIVWPGQACAYMVGRQTINELRARARAELGDGFDIRAFHDQILLNGSTPLSTLERTVLAWIEAQKSKTAAPKKT